MNGADESLRLAYFDKHLKWADLVITGEGRFDDQSFMGKICGRIISAARNKQIGIICGISSLGKDITKYNLSFIIETGKNKPDPIKNAKKYLVDEVRLLAKNLVNNGKM